MLKKEVLSAVFVFMFQVVVAQNFLPQVISGKIVRIENFSSIYVGPRNIDVWLPANYSSEKKYAVLYMHDGQMLFDSSQTWNKQAWDVDDISSELMLSKKVRDFIVVGIWNNGKFRHSEYFPQKPFGQLTKQEKDSFSFQLRRGKGVVDEFKPNSDNYLKFIVKELKPFIDSHYSVSSNKENTYIAGSSMGGLISLYAICEYPNIFGGAACLSTHWIGSYTLNNNPIPQAILNYLEHKLPKLKHHKLYFDCGDQTLDALYPAIQGKVDSLMRENGFNERNWLTQYFPGEDHSEKSWKKRLQIPLQFLFGIN